LGWRRYDRLEGLQFAREAGDGAHGASGAQNLDGPTRRGLGRVHAALDRVLDLLAQMEGFFDAEPPAGHEAGRDRLGLASRPLREILDGSRVGLRQAGAAREAEKRLHESGGERRRPALHQIHEGLGEDAGGGVTAARMLDDADRLAAEDEIHDIGERHVALRRRVVQLPVRVAGDGARHGRTDHNAMRYRVSREITRCEKVDPEGGAAAAPAEAGADRGCERTLRAGSRRLPPSGGPPG
jgi:hypothetical protein